MIELEGSVEGDSGLEEMIARLKQVDGQSVSAGVFGGFAAQKAMWNEYGTSRGIPARPFYVTRCMSTGQNGQRLYGHSWWQL